ncbi:MAG: FAD:protein FMN transferase, partial [Phaeodactylibacter sp.]|nr:FAD:protein FMN transferase [Phaeodactylibacter sp.]
MRFSPFLFGYLGLLCFTLLSCKRAPTTVTENTEGPYVRVEGKTMGTYYRVQYQDSLGRDFKHELDALLVEMNDELSTYIDSSTISRFNQAEESLEIGGALELIDANTLQQSGPDTLKNTHFVRNLFRAQQIYEKTKGSFDPTVMPLVNYWGFGYTAKKPVTAVDSLKVKELQLLVGLNNIAYENGILYKSLPGVQLDFSAIAKGYAVDQLAAFLEDKGAVNYLVDIGGEMMAHGSSQRGGVWKIGINTPREEADIEDYEVIVDLDNQALATSGNYRNFYDFEGRKYAHTINPKTGFPELSTLLSASVFAPDCATADAYATSFMV